jgi:hypothetical protein
MSHMEYDEVTSMINWLKVIYGDMKVSLGKVQDYICMALDYTKKGEVKVTMIDYMRGETEDFPEMITRGAATPATENLFEVWPDESRILLDEKRGRAFHHATAQLMFASSRARKDIQCAIAFLTTRVKTPDEDDWGKLKRLLWYTRSTIYMPLILRADGLNIVKWWVDASFFTHKECRGHTSETMSIGRGSIIRISKKQKINTRSSTEVELVGVDDVAPQMLWMRYFMEEQGMKIEESVLNQDNLSTMLLEKNGKESSSKRTTHI